jgi:hypothetical protein
MSAVAKLKLNDERIHALALDATRGAARLLEQIHRALCEPVTVADLLRYREDASKLVTTLDLSLLDRAKHAVRELEEALEPAAVVRDYRESAITYITVRDAQQFVDEVSKAAEPLLALRRKK